MISVWRIGHCASPQAADPVLLASLGFGSTLGNGRWHVKNPQQQMGYAGSSRAICQLEKRVHCNGSSPKQQALMRLELPEQASLLHVGALGLPPHWREDQAISQRIGMAWLQSGASLGLWVPSFIEQSELNLLLNPAHPEYPQIHLSVERNPFLFDPPAVLRSSEDLG